MDYGYERNSVSKGKCNTTYHPQAIVSYCLSFWYGGISFTGILPVYACVPDCLWAYFGATRTWA